jgi:endogenous inhibitor of DNA gyrase (YacG/DUF329 family)
VSKNQTQLKVNCPTCKKAVPWNEEYPHRPFCSERCQKIDLGAWADESYSIPVETADEWSESQSTVQLPDHGSQTFH